ncbi:MAG: bifunctional NAD(P)/FAD-dependent oxidoreductase/class I SAM-dependent methyltransferase [Microbacterium sp.]
METWDAVIIGAGAAGLSAAQMLGRSRRRTLVLDAGSPRNRFAAHMHGILGQDGTAPGDLLARGRSEVEHYGVEVRAASVARVDESASHVTVTLAGGGVETARALVVATGITDVLPAVPGLAERWGTSVLHCPYCHGWEVRDRRIGVLLTSPLQVHQAQLVRQWSDDVVVFDGVGLDPAARRRLRSRGVEIVDEPVDEVLGDGAAVTGIRLRDGRTEPVQAIFAAGEPRPHDGFLAHLGLARDEAGLIAVDAAGRTSSPRIWAAGNVVSPFANVPLSMGAGAMAGAAANGALVEEDFDNAPAQYWDRRYADQLWSGRPNRTLVDVVRDLAPGRSLDIGSGEGADVIWLARQGWDATGVDISETAVHRARQAAEAAGVDARFVTTDLSVADTAGSFDLVTASFFHSPVALDRAGALRRGAASVAPAGRLLIVSHAGPPPWAPDGHGGSHTFPSPAEELEALGLDPAEWTVEIVGTRPREAVAPDGTPAMLDDVVVLARRRALSGAETAGSAG